MSVFSNTPCSIWLYNRIIQHETVLFNKDAVQETPSVIFIVEITFLEVVRADAIHSEERRNHYVTRNKNVGMKYLFDIRDDIC